MNMGGLNKRMRPFPITNLVNVEDLDQVPGGRKSRREIIMPGTGFQYVRSVLIRT